MPRMYTSYRLDAPLAGVTGAGIGTKHAPDGPQSPRGHSRIGKRGDKLLHFLCAMNADGDKCGPASCR